MTMLEGHDELRSVGGLQLWARNEGAGTVLTAIGEIDMESSVVLRQVLTELIETGHHRVVIDMGEVTFIDPSGLAALVAARNTSREHNSSLRLVGIAGGPAKILEITGLAHAFPVWDTVEDALTS